MKKKTNRYCCSVAKSCLTLYNPMDCSMPGFPVLHYQSLLKFISIESVMLSNHFILRCFLLLLLSIFSNITVFSRELFPSDGQSIGASASALVLSMNIQGWFPLPLTGLISLLSKGISRVFSSTTIWKHQFFSIQLPLLSNSHIHVGKTIALTICTFVGKVKIT